MNTEKLFVIAHSSIEEYRNDGDDADRYYLPWRVVAESAARITKGQKVLTILPRHHEFNEFLGLLEQELLGGQKIPTMFTSDAEYLMDTDIENELLPDLRRNVNDGSILYPYQATPEFYKWANPLQEDRVVKVFSDRKERDNRFWWGQKGAYHRWIDDLDIPGLAERYRLPFPKGFIAKDPLELEKAVELLQTQNVVLKPIYGAGGFQIGFCETPEDLASYEWPIDPITEEKMPIAVQERVAIIKDGQGERVYSLQFNNRNIFGVLTRQKMESANWRGNIIPSGAQADFEQRCYQYAERLLFQVNPQGSGGVDIADVCGNPVFLEVNGGRPTGAHTPKYFQQAFAPRAPHFVFEKIDPGSHTAHEAWDLLQSHHMPGLVKSVGFDKSKQTGVFPIVWLKDSWGMLASFAESYNVAENQLQKAKEILSK